MFGGGVFINKQERGGIILDFYSASSDVYIKEVFGFHTWASQFQLCEVTYEVF